MGHTPGPWRLDGDAHAMNLDVFSGEGRIAMMECENFELPDDELAANARLIAAAPDLLAALENMLNLTLDEDDIAVSSRITKARAAIAKAKEAA